MSGRNMYWQLNTTQNDRVPLYLNYSLLTLQCNFIQTSTCQCIIKNEIILLNLI